MEKVYQFLNDVGVFYLATIDSQSQPRVRPFGAVDYYNGRLYFITGKVKNVARQIALNPKVEICGFKDGKWLRIEGELIEDDSVDARIHMLNTHPELKTMYNENDGNMEVLYLKNVTATFYSFATEPEIIKF